MGDASSMCGIIFPYRGWFSLVRNSPVLQMTEISAANLLNPVSCLTSPQSTSASFQRGKSSPSHLPSVHKGFRCTWSRASPFHLQHEAVDKAERTREGDRSVIRAIDLSPVPVRSCHPGKGRSLCREKGESCEIDNATGKQLKKGCWWFGDGEQGKPRVESEVMPDHFRPGFFRGMTRVVQACHIYVLCISLLVVCNGLELSQTLTWVEL